MNNIVLLKDFDAAKLRVQTPGFLSDGTKLVPIGMTAKKHGMKMKLAYGDYNFSPPIAIGEVTIGPCTEYEGSFGTLLTPAPWTDETREKLESYVNRVVELVFENQDEMFSQRKGGGEKLTFEEIKAATNAFFLDSDEYERSIRAKFEQPYDRSRGGFTGLNDKTPLVFDATTGTVLPVGPHNITTALTAKSKCKAVIKNPYVFAKYTKDGPSVSITMNLLYMKLTYVAPAKSQASFDDIDEYLAAQAANLPEV